MKDSGDLHGVVAKSVKIKVLAASETPATSGEIIPRFAAGKVWIGHNLVSRATEKHEIGESLFRSPDFFVYFSIERRLRSAWLDKRNFIQSKARIQT